MGRKSIISDSEITQKIIESQEVECTIPSLALSFHVCRGTINNAIKRLVKDGKVRERRRLANLRIYEAV